MKTSVYEAEAKFRVSRPLLDAAREHARSQGRTFSEVMRDALRRELADAA